MGPACTGLHEFRSNADLRVSCALYSRGSIKCSGVETSDCAAMPALSALLAKYACPSNHTPTHTAIGGENVAGGSFEIPSTSYDEFIDAYCESLSNKTQNFTERPCVVFPVISDIDLQYHESPDQPERKHDEGFIAAVAVAYANAIGSMRILQDTRSLQIIVMQRIAPYIKKEGVVRDGLHLLIPSCRLPRVGQAVLRKRALPALADALSSHLDGQTLAVEDAVDSCYAENGTNWQLYGSAKPDRSPYLVTHEVRVDMAESDHAGASTSSAPAPTAAVRVVVRPPPRPANDWHYWTKRLSVRSDAPSNMDELNAETAEEIDRIEQSLSKTAFDVVCERETSAGRGPDCVQVSDAPEENNADAIARARAAVRCLADWRADKYHSWRDVGFALRNTSATLMDAWLTFSQRSPKFNRYTCESFWNKLKTRDGGLTVGSLVFWAQFDNPQEFDRINENDIKESLMLAIKHNNHTDWGNYVLKRKDGLLRATPDGNSHSIYVFSKELHRWKLDEDGSTIKRFLKSEIVAEISAVQNEFQNDSDFCKACLRAENSLKSRGFRDNVFLDIRETVSDPDFRSLLDSNPNLIGWTNGVFDLEQQEFREGRPEDYVSMTCGHEHKDPDHPDFQRVAEQFRDFISKVHKNPDLRKYCLDALATALSGKTIFEIMHTWTGTGSNGKTRMLNLMDMALGDYICTAPPSLLTGTRPDSGKATPELCAAAGARLLIMSEVDGKATINVAVMKELSGGEKIATRELYKKATVMVPQFTMLLTCNDLSKVDSNDDGTWRRLKVLPFNSKFVTSNPRDGEFQADTSLDKKLKTWAPYVLSMLQARYPQAVKDMACDPPEIKRQVSNYRAASDLDQDFLSKNMVRASEDESPENFADAWALLNTYRREGRDHNITLSKLQEKLARFGVPPASDQPCGRKVFNGWCLALHGR